MNELQALSRHVASCAVCGWLCRLAVRRRNLALLESAVQLRATHVANDAELEVFTKDMVRRPSGASCVLRSRTLTDPSPPSTSPAPDVCQR